MRQILLTVLFVGVANVLHAADSSVPKTAYKKNSAMELLFESRTEITEKTGEIYLAHPTKAYLVSWMPRILSLRNSGSRNP